MNIRYITIISLAALIPAVALASILSIGSFSSGELSGSREETFRGKNATVYSLVTENSRSVLKAESHHAASGLLKKVDIDPVTYPVIRWSWKVAHTLDREDVTRKSGDDFAARVYVVFPGTFFWKTRAINYVWSARLPRNTAVPSPYTGNAVILAVESGEERAGIWVSEERNIREDYKRVFGGEPPRIGAVAVMTDTDDTGGDVTSWYGDITLSDH